ncbi:hypothetical protein HRbin22_01316 [Candidatus Thermoflexus japonica]|uniref:Uncharacterized protein n=1 Tax=Candidatus Thermoflexus japonica TaxID=2035417 RepID=A0A2H5Y6I7_9CHLR|nr:hypothetical protein HRbin22_01316 [Candidatus Thermoflexus japonica]
MHAQIPEEGSEGLRFWSALRRSAEGLYPGYAELADLRFALDEGWTIEPPVYVDREAGWRPYYHILLRREGRQVLLSLPESDALHRFLEEQRVPMELRSTRARARRSARARSAG